MSSVLSRNQEALIKSLYTRHGRKKHNLCICEGVRCCSEFLNSAPALMEFAVCSENFDISKLPQGITPTEITEKDFRTLSSTIESQGILIVARKPEEPPPNIPPADKFIVILDHVGDPGNFGTILRTGKSIGLSELWFTSGSADPFSDKVIRAGMASQFSMKIKEFSNIHEAVAVLKKFSFSKFYRTNPHGGRNCFTEESLFDKSAIIFGSEGQGAEEFSEAIQLSIPMPGNYESINVAQAATVILFEHVRRSSILPQTS